MSGDFIRNAWLRRVNRSSVAPPPPPENAPPAARRIAASPAGGFGGGAQGVAQPTGESLNDQIRQRVFGSP
jgi:hypothetical protein